MDCFIIVLEIKYFIIDFNVNVIILILSLLSDIIRVNNNVFEVLSILICHDFIFKMRSFIFKICLRWRIRINI